MRSLFILIFLTLTELLIAQGSAEKDSVFVHNTNTFNTNYKEFEVLGKLVYAITNQDSLIKIDLSNNQMTFLKSNIKSIAKTKKNKIIVATENGNVLRQIRNNKFEDIDTFEGIPQKILIDKNDDFILLTTKYLRFKRENFIPDRESPMYRKAGRVRASSTIIPVDVYYLDDEERVWFGYDAGEWGGNLYFFDLNEKQFFADRKVYKIVNHDFIEEDGSTKSYKKVMLKTKTEEFQDYPEIVKVIEGDTLLKFPYNLYIANIKGITQNEKGDFYFAESLMHFDVRSYLSKKIKTIEKDFYKDVDISDVLDYKILKNDFTDSEVDSTNETISIELKISLEYLGGVSFNKFDKHVYYYTNTGFWKLIEQENNYSKKFIFRPIIKWTAGLPDSVGYQMNVKKFEFINEKEFVFLTSSNGIGYFKENLVTYFK